MICELLYKFYAIKQSTIRRILRKIISKLEGGELYSHTLRRIFKDYHDIEIGLYTHGGCFIVAGNMGRSIIIGRYSSIANAHINLRNHPMKLKSTHGFFFNPKLKYCNRYLAESNPLKIGNDVWIGDGAMILPDVTEIADGAVIAAGAIVNKNVPPYAVVVGNPARIVRYRFPQEIIDKLLASRWWEKSIEEIQPGIEEYFQPYEKLYFERKQSGGEA